MCALERINKMQGFETQHFQRLTTNSENTLSRNAVRDYVYDYSLLVPDISCCHLISTGNFTTKTITYQSNL